MNENIKVLLIEDNPGDARLIEVMLKEAELQFELKRVDHLSSGIGQMKSDSFDAILLDLGLPDSQGLNTLMKISEIELEAPVIVLTGLADETIRTQAIKEGAQDYLIKGQIDKNLLARSINYAIERKRAEDALRASEARFLDLYENAPNAYFSIGVDGRIRRCNRRAGELLGYDVEKLTGRPAVELYADTPYGKEKAAMVLQRFLASETVRDEELQMQRADGAPVWISLTVNAILDSRGRVVESRSIVVDITERKKAEKVTRESEDRYRRITMAITDYIYTVRIEDGRPVETTHGEACVSVTGYTKEEFTAEPYLWIEIIVKEDRAILIKQAEEVLSGRYPSPIEHRIIRKDGALRWVESSLVPKYDIDGNLISYDGIIRDITERKRNEEALRNSEKFIEDILASVDEAFVVVDREYRILSANRAYCEQAGKSLAEITGKHCYEISHHVTRPCHEREQDCACKRTFETGESAVNVHSHTDSKGKQRQVEIKTYAMKDESGGVKSIIEVINDITEKTALEHQLRQAQKMESIGTLAGGIAHDFNNILSAIIGYGHLTLMKMQPNDPLRMNIDHILESADRAASLTQSLLTLSRKQIVDRKPVDLNSVLREVEKFLVRVIGEDVVFRLALAEGVIAILADAGQLEQVFMNLATNARDAMPNGGSFTIETSIIGVNSGFVTAHGYGKPGSYAMISVTDIGVGMNEETRKKIFEPFFTTKEVGKGTGLGLAMVYGILKQNDGFINVYSEPGKGTTFRIYLPLIKDAAVEGQRTIAAEYPKGGTETILLAEDDANLRQLTLLVLKQMGYTVITANDGEEAVTKFMENKDRIQLLLFDIIMPRKNGREAYEEIRRVMPNVPMLFASGYSPDMLRVKALIEESSAIVYKPISPLELSKKVREMLDLKK
jgi:PAS domain S-box-containing protein